MYGLGIYVGYDVVTQRCHQKVFYHREIWFRLSENEMIKDVIPGSTTYTPYDT